MPASTDITEWAAEESAVWEIVLDEAWRSYLARGWGVGAAATVGGQILSVAGNATDPACGSSFFQHAEIRALSGLPSSVHTVVTVYTSLEPCVLCLGALTFCRVPEVRFAARDLSFSAAHRALSQAPILGTRVPAMQGPRNGRIGAFCRLLPLVAEIEHGLGSQRFGLEERLCPRLLDLAVTCIEQHLLSQYRLASGERAWPDAIKLLAVELDAAAQDLEAAERTLRRLQIL
ncbi:hypothetical protein AB0H83_37290 [Dactylosporangium sp. NPDC050688]|uniref:hypothetical protein n=1 Tax=Dactylosporangium sp. NPDC050688 TaxID=3157217 RepID=UPI003404A061